MTEFEKQELGENTRCLSLELERIEAILINNLIKCKNDKIERQKFSIALNKTTLINNHLDYIKNLNF